MASLRDSWFSGRLSFPIMELIDVCKDKKIYKYLQNTIGLSEKETEDNWLADLSVQHRVYVHINNTNPMLNESGSEHAQVLRCDVRVGTDAHLA